MRSATLGSRDTRSASGLESAKQHSAAFSRESGMRLEMIARLMDALGLEIVIRPQRETKKGE